MSAQVDSAVSSHSASASLHPEVDLGYQLLTQLLQRLTEDFTQNPSLDHNHHFVQLLLELTQRQQVLIVEYHNGVECHILANSKHHSLPLTRLQLPFASADEHQQQWQLLLGGQVQTVLSQDHRYALILTGKSDQSQHFANGLLAAVLQLYLHTAQHFGLEKKLVSSATYDAITGLPNRRLIRDEIKHAISDLRPGESTLVLYIDLSRFKYYEKNYGQEASQQLLQTVARRLCATLKDQDKAACLGSDQFVVLLPRVRKLKVADIVARKIIHAINQPINVQGRDITLSCNIGIASSPQDGRHSSELIHFADTAMFEARKQAKNSYSFYTQAIAEQLQEQQAIEHGLRTALERKELSLVYQPLFDVSSGQICSLEALLRWHSPTLGAVAPDKFIPIAEEDGFIEPLGHWVIFEGCRQLALWEAEGLGKLKLAINLSPRQLDSAHFISQTLFALEKHQVLPQQIEFEVTESLFIGGQHQAEKLHQLVALGFKLAIDDFGTGYSSLSYLSQYPFSYLKIDRSFVSDVLEHQQKQALIEAIVAMAHRLNMKVIAEGVEHLEQAQYLQSRACDIFQGYYYAKPLPPEEIINLLQK